MECPKCHAEVADNSRFCPDCGWEFETVEAEETDKKTRGTVEKIAVALVVTAAVVYGVYLLFGFNSGTDRKAESAVNSGAWQSENLDTRLETLLEKADDNPEDSKILVDIGNIYFDTNNFAQGLIYYQKALKLDPENVEVLIDAGVCFFNIGNINRAKQNFEAALEIDPNHPVGLYNLGVVYSNLGNHEKAAELWHKILEVAPASPQAEAIRQMLNSSLNKKSS
jgi:cytochrome c-type biogenesis protein CcmH/NrfG